jgi:lantibiotic modifying enzyme
MGLYTGFAGIATVLELTYAASHDARYRAGASRALSLVRRAAQPAGEGVEWNPSTDIISGSAGIGLFLLWARDRIGDERVVELAARAGTRLVERARPSHGGLSWLIQPDMGRNYPNFSHGAAGVSYFLASLYAVTRRAEFLDAARAGATYLDAISTTTPNGGRMVYHSTPGNEQLFYLSWCHGPAGTARLYHRLAAITGDAAWRGRVPALATAIRDMGVPGRSPGFWENVSQCCGNAGVVEFFLDLHRTSADPAHLSMAERVAGDALRRATADGDGLKWVQAEHRVQPALRIAQTGLMQGAAGVGLALLHLDGATQARAPFVVLPDNPFAVESRRGA